MASFCSKCGTAAAPGVRFCSECGAPLEAGPGQAKGPNAPQPPSPPQMATPLSNPAAGGFGTSAPAFPAPTKRTGPSTLLLVVLGIVLALFAVFGSCAYFVVHKARQVALRVKADLPRVQRELEEKSHQVAVANDVCALITSAELEEVYGESFSPGQRRGQECIFSKSGRTLATVTVRLDHSLSRFDQTVKAARAHDIEQQGEVRSFFSSQGTLHVSYRWNYLEISAEGGHEKCRQIEELVLKRL
jgi:zinc-ribbon domain